MNNHWSNKETGNIFRFFWHLKGNSDFRQGSKNGGRKRVGGTGVKRG